MRVIQSLVFVFVATLLCALLAMAGATFVVVKYHTPASDTSTIMGHRYDTILLKGAIDAFSYSNVTVRQCIDRGDDYHDTNMYVLKTQEIKLKQVRSFHQYEWHYQDLPSYKSAIEDYLYLLPDSSFTYWICLSSTTDYNQTATYLLFDDALNYWNYVNDQENGEVYSMFSQPLLARQNLTTCTEISRSIEHPSYYFMMVRSPGNISYSYNFTLKKVAYDTMDVKAYCKVGELNNCEVSLGNDSFKHIDYSIIAYIQPSEFENSIVTHFCISTNAGSETLTKLSYISDALFGVGGALLVFTVFLFLCFLLMSSQRCKLMHNEEKQRLLHHY